MLFPGFLAELSFMRERSRVSKASVAPPADKKAQWAIEEQLRTEVTVLYIPAPIRKIARQVTDEAFNS